MSREYSSPLQAASEWTAKDITRMVHVNETLPDQYEEAGFGGSADIFSGKYTREDGSVMKVAIKCMRVKNTDISNTKKEKLQRRLARELDIWHHVSSGANIIKLLGTITGIGPLPSPVCELCPWNLQDYLDRKTPRPKHIKMMTDTISGLSYMHEISTGPIAHGDVKLSNILVTANETALLCDFGSSRKPHSQPDQLPNPSSFAGTVRYMSPELFVPNKVGPTPAADMWAYGCVALEILCRIRPYHEIGELQVAEYIKNGHPPSDRPRGPRASLINDPLWATLSSCWQAQDWRPTSRVFLERLMEMLQNGELSTSPVLSELFPIIGNSGGPMALDKWPDELDDLRDQLEVEWSIGPIASSVRSKVWLALLTGGGNTSQSALDSDVAIKVPRLNAGLQSYRHDHLQNILRKMVRNRFGVRHPNIVDLLGIDSSFTPHPGLVLEHCDENLVVYCKQNPVNRNELTRPPSPEANAYSLVSDILEGLRYMHDYPVPIPQGDLTPENVLVTRTGIAKISLFSFGRALAALPPAAALTPSVGALLPLRWISPELLGENQQPTTESDMWALGCVYYWILTGLEPYSSHRRDDFAGAESIRGEPPGTLANVDHYSSSWITNGIWNTVGRCWNYDPLLRPNAKDFLKVLKTLQGRKLRWLPVDVVDLAGKVKPIDTGYSRATAKIAQYVTVWCSYSYVKKKSLDNIHITMDLYETTYAPKWYSRAVPATVKLVADRPFDKQPLIASIRHEVTITAQLDHSHICRLLGIDSGHDQEPLMIFEFCSRVTLNTFLQQHGGSFDEYVRILADVTSAIVYLHEHVNGAIAHGDVQPGNIFVLPDGRAKLANFTCSFQYIVGQPTSRSPLSAVISIPRLPSLYSGPEYYQERADDHVPLPTVASDIWSFGSVMLSTFSEEFRNKAPSEHIAQLMASVAPCDSVDNSALEDRVLALIRPVLVYEPSHRPSARDVLNRISDLM